MENTRMDGPNPASLANFVRAIAILALPADRQIAWLRSLGLGEPCYTDELALEFADGYLLLSQFIRFGWLSSDVAEPLALLDALLSDISGAEKR